LDTEDLIFLDITNLSQKMYKCRRMGSV